MKEGVDYILETEENPGEGEMEFNIRFLKGDYVETIIGFTQQVDFDEIVVSE